MGKPGESPERGRRRPSLLALAPLVASSENDFDQHVVMSAWRTAAFEASPPPVCERLDPR